MTNIVLTRSDFGNDLHPRFWEELCEQLGTVKREAGASPRYPEELHLTVRSAEAHY